MEEWDQACTEGDTGVSDLFFHCYLNRIEVFFLLYSYFRLLSSFVFVDPNETNSLKVALPLQVPLMAYSDRYSFLW